jgi:hypothetical protein
LHTLEALELEFPHQLSNSCELPIPLSVPSALHIPHLYLFLLRPNRRSPKSVILLPRTSTELEATNACHYHVHYLHHCSPARRPHLITLLYRCDSSAPRCSNGITRKLFVQARLFPQAIPLEHPPTSEVSSSRICAFQNTSFFPSGWKIFTSHKCTRIILISDRHVIHQPLYIALERPRRLIPQVWLPTASQPSNFKGQLSPPPLKSFIRSDRIAPRHTQGLLRPKRILLPQFQVLLKKGSSHTSQI